ncbi:MAG TPA: flagellar biosynthetic protein FliO [Dongiaceae bacterium]|nr:flagellar biosynthetic protein FliO [Dongiaceae bacterium]
MKTEPARGDGTNMGTASAQMVLGLGFVLAVIFGLAWVAKRFNLNGAGTGAGMRVVGATTLGPKEKLVLVEVDGKRLLLGVTAHQISLLQTGDAIPVAPVEAGEFAGRIQALLKTGTLHEK